MKNQIIQLGEENRKVFGFSDEQIVFSSKAHTTFESLQSATEKSGMLESVTTIPIETIKEIYFNEKDNTFTIKYDKADKIKKDIVVLKDINLRESIINELASLVGLAKNSVEESKTGPLIANLLGIIGIFIFTWFFRIQAINAQNGEHYIATGRGSGKTQLFADTIEAIGPMWITVLGVLGIIYMIYRTNKRYKNPALIIKYV
jgi:hypothetical protein